MLRLSGAPLPISGNVRWFRQNEEDHKRLDVFKGRLVLTVEFLEKNI